MLQWLLDFVRFLRFSRTLTSVPFAVGAYAVAADGGGSLVRFLYVITSVILGVAAFLFFNRAYEYGRLPRASRDRERERLLTVLGPRLSVGLTVIASVLFMTVAYQLNSTTFYCSPVALLVMFSYVPLRCRSIAHHGLLGAAGALLVLGPHVAVSGDLTPAGMTGGIAVGLWILGFDIVYSLRRIAGDRTQGYHSMPVEYGQWRSIILARVVHGLSGFAFLAYAVLADLNGLYVGGMILVTVLGVLDHRDLPRTDVLEGVNRFFRLHVVLAIGFATLTILGTLIP